MSNLSTTVDRRHSSESEEVDETTILTNSILRLSSLVEEQNALLRRNNQWKERQPMAVEVPATSSSAWNALLRSTLADTIQPKAEGWRSGLDALLVFLGLFSAIVTAFIVPSLLTLKQDEIARTNEILSNITNILVTIVGSNLTHSDLAPPSIFVPAASDVRFNVYLTLSLIISLSIGVLAISCRGFLNLVSWSHHNKAVERLTDIRARWKSAEQLLGPAIESLPQMLAVPVFLFIVGLVDSIFSVSLQIPSPPVSILVTSGLAVAFVAAVAAGMGFTLIDGSLRPTISPFQSRLAHLLNVSVVQNVTPFFLRLHMITTTALGTEAAPRRAPPINSAQPLSPEATDTYHEVVQATRDDDILDEAAAALFNVIAQRTNYHSPSHRFFKRHFRRLPVDLLPQECGTLLHLLSPEASIRSHRTAAQVIVDIASNGRAHPLRYSQNDIRRLLPSLSHAARRAVSEASFADLWDSVFLRAMAIVAHSGSHIATYPPAIVFIGSEHWSWKYLIPDELSDILAFIFEVLEARLKQELAALDIRDQEAAEASLVDELFSSPTLAIGQNSSPLIVVVNARNVLASLLHLPHPAHSLFRILVSWLLRLHPATQVIVAAQTHVEIVQRTERLQLLGHREYMMVPRMVSTLAERCLTLDGFTAHEPLARLCTLCLLHTPSIRSRPPSGFVFFARPLLRALLQAVKSHVDLAAPQSQDLLRDLLEIRRVVTEDLLWKDGRLEMLRALEDLLGVDDTRRSSSAQIALEYTDSDGFENTRRTPSPGGIQYEAAEAGRSAAVVL
ncbi:hypothetical protein C8F04DRAFT_1011383 [Mycena alexandri]|uniref:DUF6535 domain-containing protein n=1 Tax=Mycena alexandri TaxID=1745969 RepID=A0AAD6S936_9AGAR|nr:hypothetical protein C8F04DRAFT_1011383 [Mycena alexandri]